MKYPKVDRVVSWRSPAIHFYSQIERHSPTRRKRIRRRGGGLFAHYKILKNGLLDLYSYIKTPMRCHVSSRTSLCGKARLL